MPIPYQKSYGGTNTIPTEFQLTNNLSFKEGNETRMLIQSNGHLAVSQDIHMYDSSNISTGTLKYSLGVSSDGNSFQVVNEVTNTVIFDASNATPYYDKTYLDNSFNNMAYNVATEDYVDTEIDYVSHL